MVEVVEVHEETLSFQEALVNSPRLPLLNDRVLGRFLNTKGIEDVCPPTKSQTRQRMPEKMEQRILWAHVNG